MLNPEQITRNSCIERFTNVLREHVGPGKQFSTSAAAEKLNLQTRTMQSYLGGENLPPMTVLLQMFALFDTNFSNRILRIAGLDGCFRQDVQPVTDLELNAEAAAMVGELGRALRSGRINHRDRPEVLHEARTLRAELDNWIAIAEGTLPENNENISDYDPSVMAARIRRSH